MNKGLLIKFFRGEASEQEIDRIIEWVGKSPQNRSYFAEIKTLWAISGSENISVDSIKRRKTILRKLSYASVAALIIVLLAVNIFLSVRKYSQEKEISNITEVLPENQIRSLYTEKGVKGFVILPDSSKVWLNSDSKIKYPVAFDTKMRNVEISGEAYFEVKVDKKRPMIVRTNKDFRIEVLGTSFLVKSYENDKEARTTLYSGSINLHFKNKKTLKEETARLNPDESFICYDEGKYPVIIRKAKIENQLAWKEGRLIFEQTPMDEVLKMLERWHGTTFIVKNESIYSYNLSAVFQSESIVQILEMIECCIPVKYEIDHNIVTLH